MVFIKLQLRTYITDFGARLRVKKGDTVTNGDRLTEGTIKPSKLLEASGSAAVQQYIIKEVQKVYRSQGIGISDKHIEVIVRQMLRKLFVVDRGDTDLVTGTRVSIQAFNEANEKVLLAGKNPAVAKPLILGITKAALETDSFLSAASFQETNRVLTDAAIKGKIDPLHGLKENVITGKLIPVGNGLKSEAEERIILTNFDVLETMREVKKQYIGVHDSEHSLDDENAQYREEESLMTEDPR